MKNTYQNKNKKHEAVMLDDVKKYLAPKLGESYLDLTAGYGGHAGVILEQTQSPKLATLVDRDQDAVDYLTKTFSKQKIEIIHQDFLGASHSLEKSGRSFDMILADFGVSSPHLNEAQRGFSIRLDGPLDMRMDQSQSLMASTVVNEYRESDIAQVIKDYGEEPRADRIARLIVSNRPIRNTSELAALIKQAWPRYSRIHPATKTFQAIRIAVNNELNQIESSLPTWINLLNPGGRIAIISFHGLEDRLVKNFFKDLAGDRYDSVLKVLTKHPVVPSQVEVVINPRARSAKLRAAVKIKNRKGELLNHADYSKKPLPDI